MILPGRDFLNLFGVLALLSCSVSAHAADAAEPTSQSDGNSGRNKSSEPCGILEGAVIYEPDPERPWRLQRNYVRDPRSGFLAEAVVCLQGPFGTACLPPHTNRTAVMDQVNFQFVPETLAVQKDDSVAFQNSDAAYHNVMTSDGANPFNVSMAMGGSYTHKFKQAGGWKKPVRLSCAYHGSMRAWIFVFDHPYFHVTGEDGRFRIDRIPPGTYHVVMVHPAGRLLRQQQVQVKAGQTLDLTIRVSPDEVNSTE